MSFKPPPGSWVPVDDDGMARCVFSPFSSTVVAKVSGGVGNLSDSELDDLRRHLDAHAETCDDAEKTGKYCIVCEYMIFLAQHEPDEWLPPEKWQDRTVH